MSERQHAIERKLLEERLSKSKAKYQDLYDNAPDMFVSVDAETTKIIQCNQTLATALGYSKEEIIGRPIFDMYHSDSLEDAKKAFRSFTETGKVQNAEMQLKRKDGSKIDVSLNVSSVRDERGKVLYSRSVWRDITERKQVEEKLGVLNETLEQRVAERTSDLTKANIQLEQSIKDLKSTQQQLIQSEKMASVGQLAASVAHEINNPLSYIYNNFYILARYFERLGKFLKKCEEAKPIFDKGEAAQMTAFFEELQDLKKEVKLDAISENLGDVINESIDGVERIKSIVLNLSTFSHIGKEKPLYAHLDKLIENVLVVVHGELKHKAKIIKEYGDIPEIRCFPQQLGQVFMNLLINAAHSIEGKGKISIKTYKEGDNAYVEIKDNGKGIPEDLQGKIFDPFFTTKEPGKGTGLGLSVSYDIIQKHSGKINVSSKVGEGTAFTIILPISGKGE
jgi:PAS domain S-box-containing protein